MAMTREEREFAKQVSDETADDRRKAIAKAGPLFNDARRNTLERMLAEDCRLSNPDDIASVMDAFTAAGSDDEADVREAVRNALGDALKKAFKTGNPNQKFLQRESDQISKIVQAAMDERDRKIVADGGPARPKYMLSMT